MYSSAKKSHIGLRRHLIHDMKFRGHLTSKTIAPSLPHTPTGSKENFGYFVLTLKSKQQSD